MGLLVESQELDRTGTYWHLQSRDLGALSAVGELGRNNIIIIATAILVIERVVGQAE